MVKLSNLDEARIMAAELDGLCVGGRDLQARVDKTKDSKLTQHGDDYWEKSQKKE